MASLNTLRTKFGILLSVVIAFALLAFILSLKTDIGLSGNDPKVGEIDGDKVTYSEFMEEYDNVKMRAGVDNSYDEAQAEQLNSATWQSLFSSIVLEPSFEKMGIVVTDNEEAAIIRGDEVTQSMYSVFANPSTGVYDMAVVSNFLSQAEKDPKMAAMWADLKTQAKLERQMNKYLALVKQSVYTNKLEVENEVNNAKSTLSGRVVCKKYSKVEDSLFNVSKAEIKAYYKKNKSMFKQRPNREIMYAVFESVPTSQDYTLIESIAKSTAADFAAAPSATDFVKTNKNGKVGDNFKTYSQFESDEANALFANATYGPVKVGDTWHMSRVASTKIVPDTIGLRHIVLQYNQDKLADSLYTLVKGGADFAQLAKTYSLSTTGQNGGDAGVYPYSAFTAELIDGLANVKAGDILKIKAGSTIQIMQIYRAGAPVKHIQTATIDVPIEPSPVTLNNVYTEASHFSVESKGSLEKFNEAARTMSVTPRVATINQGDRMIQGLDDSRELTRWAYDAKVGDVSEIIKVNGNYVIAVLTSVDKDDYKSLEKATEQITKQLLKDKKYDYIVKKANGATLEEVAQSLGSKLSSFENLKFDSFYVDGCIGMDPLAIASMARIAHTGELKPAIKGTTGVYYVIADAINVENISADDAKAKLQARKDEIMERLTIPSIQIMSNIQNLGGKYF